MTPVRLYLTGDPMAESGETVVRPVDRGGRQGSLVFVLLGWERHRLVPRDELAEMLWGENLPGAWETSLSAVVSNVRKGLSVIDGVGIQHAAGCYRLSLPPDSWIDVEAAYGAVHEAEGAIRMGRMDDVYAWSGIATTITKRPFLSGEDGPWIDDRRRELNALRTRSLECAIEFCIWNREWGPAQRYGESLVRLDVLRESSYRTMMRVAAAAGDRAGAVKAYERCRRVLAEALGVSPHAETELLYERILGEG